MTLPTVPVVGRLTSDPELRWTPSGLAVASAWPIIVARGDDT